MLLIKSRSINKFRKCITNQKQIYILFINKINKEINFSVIHVIK